MIKYSLGVGVLLVKVCLGLTLMTGVPTVVLRIIEGELDSFGVDLTNCGPTLAN